MAGPHVAVVGGQSLIGREVRNLLAQTRFPAKVALIGAEDEEAGGLTEQDGEPVVVSALDEENLTGARLVFLADSPRSSQRAFALISKCHPRPWVVDLSYGMEDHPDARLRAPQLEPEGYQAPAEAVHVVAHPAAIVLGLFLARLHPSYPLRQVVAHVFEPASERGQRGVEELRQQTMSLLTFKSLPKDIFDAQLGFTLLARYGERAPQPLQEIEARIERHLATLLAMAGNLPRPSIRLIQAPVFHGHSFSVWAEFAGNPGVTELARTLRSAGEDVRGAGLDPPNNVGMAGQAGFAIGAIAADRNHPKACWFWLAADNLCVSAEAAVGVARSLMPAARQEAPE